MGLYSTNRIGAFSESAEDIQSIVQEIEQTSYDPDFGNLMEVSNMIAEVDQMMFESLLQADFISVTNESVMLEAEAEEANAKGNEVKKNKIIQKITQIIDTVIEAIKKAASNFIVKVTSIIKGDKKLVEKYKNLTADQLKGWKGIPNFAFPKNLAIDTEISYVAADIKDIWNDFEKEYLTAQTRENMDKAVEDAMAALNKEKTEKEYKRMFFEQEEDNFIPQNVQLKMAVKYLTTANDDLKVVKNVSAKTIAELKEIKKAVAQSNRKMRIANELQVYSANKTYAVISAICKYANKMLSLFISLSARRFAAYRKVLILAGRYASKGDKKQETTNEAALLEEAFCDAIAESSDTYVFEHLGYGLY